MHGHTFIYFRLTGKRYHSHMAGVYCIVTCKTAAGRAFSFSCSVSSLLCLLLFLPFFLLFLFLLLLLFCSLPPMLVFLSFSFFSSSYSSFPCLLWQPLTTNSAEKKKRKKSSPLCLTHIWRVLKHHPDEAGNAVIRKHADDRVSPTAKVNLTQRPGQTWEIHGTEHYEHCMRE